MSFIYLNKTGKKKKEVLEAKRLQDKELPLP